MYHWVAMSGKGWLRTIIILYIPKEERACECGYHTCTVLWRCGRTAVNYARSERVLSASAFQQYARQNKIFARSARSYKSPDGVPLAPVFKECSDPSTCLTEEPSATL